MTTPGKTSALLAEFKRELNRIYDDRLKGVFLYGSRARGEADLESDVDVLIVLDDWDHYAGEIARTSVAGFQVVARLRLEHQPGVRTRAGLVE